MKIVFRSTVSMPIVNFETYIFFLFRLHASPDISPCSKTPYEVDKPWAQL